MKDFKKQLTSNGFKRSSDGMLIDSNGQKTNLDYDKVLNDFGRNISSKGSFLLSDSEKKQSFKNV